MVSTSELLAEIPGIIPTYTDDFKEILKTDIFCALKANLSEAMPDGYVESFRYNTLKRMPETNLISDEYRCVRDADSHTFYATLRKCLTDNHLKKIPITESNMLFDMMCECNRVDPFYELISSVQWDGKPRVRRWFIDGLGVIVPGLSKEDSDKVIEEATQAWFVGAIKRCNEKACKLEIVPVLVGPQACGKTTYVEYTALKMIDASWYRSTRCSLDDEKKFFEGICGAKIVEWGEAKILKNPNAVEDLKEFITKDTDTYRPSYARYAESYSRQWASIMTTNEDTLFCDTTGNRRFVPMVCTEDRARPVPPDMREAMAEEALQVWAEALIMANAGLQPVMSTDVRALAEQSQKAFVRSNDFFEALLYRLDEDYPVIGNYLETTEVKSIIRDLKIDFSEMRDRSVSLKDIERYSEGEWISKKKSVRIGKMVTNHMCLIRAKDSPRIEKTEVMAGVWE